MHHLNLKPIFIKINQVVLKPLLAKRGDDFIFCSTVKL
jgi:hypothetical protein